MSKQSKKNIGAALRTLCALSAVVMLTSCTQVQPAETDDPLYIAVIGKGFQHDYWQTVAEGSEAAAAELGIDITFEGPPSEADVAKQIEIVQAALDEHPDALCLAATDTEALVDVLLEAQEAGVPVIGFDSGVPNAPEGVIASTASTNNYAAGQLAAEELFAEASIASRIRSASSSAPVVIGVISQDVTSASVLSRTQGFVDTFKELASSVHPNGVAITGHDSFAQPAAGELAVELRIVVGSTSGYSDLKNAAELLLQNTRNLIGVFCTNEGAVTGMLAATNEGSDLDRETGAYKDLIVVGFDAGISQKNAVRNLYIYGSITQDPYQIGYQAVMLAYSVANDELVEELVDTGCKFYTSDNMDDPDIAPLLYD